MKVKFVFVVLFSLFLSISTFGQTATDFEKNYGSVKYYEIRPLTLILPNFDKDGQICRAVVRPNHFPRATESNPFLQAETMYQSGDTNRLFPITILNSTEFREVFDELVPIETRKGKGKALIDISGFGQIYSVKFEFENITIHTRVVRYRNAVIDMNGIGENLNLFFKPPSGAIMSAVIVWKERTCVEN